MTENNRILLAALGGAVIGGLIAAFMISKKDEKPFPVSPLNESNNLRGTVTEGQHGAVSEKQEAFESGY